MVKSRNPGTLHMYVGGTKRAKALCSLLGVSSITNDDRS